MQDEPRAVPSFRWDGLFHVIAFVVAGAVAALWYLPLTSRSPIRWPIAIIAGPLVLFALAVLEVLGEGAKELLGRLPPVRRLLEWLDAATAGRRFSWLRIGIALIPAIAVFGLILAVWYFFGQRAAANNGMLP
jgi:hypothetical protein